MAIFTSTTSSGYSDPLKAMSIKALEARQKEMAGLKGDVISPENTQTPVQGMAHVLSQLGDSMAQGRNMQAIAAQRERLAQTIAHMDVNNPKGEELAVISSADPETFRDMLHTMAENRRQQAGFTHADKSQAAGFTHDDATKKGEYAHQDAAAKAKAETEELARQATAEETRIAAERKVEADKAAAAEQQKVTVAGQQPELVKMTEALRAGKIDQKTFDAWETKQTAVPASEMKAGNELQDKYLSTQGAIGDLKEAATLLGPDGTGIRAGAGAGGTQIGAKWGGDWSGLSDPKLTQRTERFNQIMSAEAISAMVEKLKGATTNEEMAKFISIMNDANAEPMTKVQALNNMIAKADAFAALQTDQLTRARLPIPGGPATTGAQAGSKDAEALEWANANPNDPRAAEIKKRLGK
jgi:hypothetical protein